MLFLAGSAPRGEAQILNTLRGFEADSPGWSGQVEGLVSLSEGNTEFLDLYLGAAVQHRSDRQRWRLLTRVSRKTTDGEETAQSRTTHLRHNYRLGNRWATVAFFQSQHDPFKDLRTRLLLGGGVRFDVVDTERWRGGIGATAMWEREKLDSIDEFEDLGRLSFFLFASRKDDPGPGLDMSAFIQPAMRDFGDTRALGELGIQFNVVGDLLFRFAYNLEFDSDPPPGVKETDHSLRSGVVFSL